MSRSNAADRRQLAKACGTAVLASATLRCGDSGPDKAHPASVPGRARIRYALPPPPSDRGGLTRRMVACPLAARPWAAHRAAVISARVGVRRRWLVTDAAYVDGLLLGEAISEDLTPLTGRARAGGGRPWSTNRAHHHAGP